MPQLKYMARFTTPVDIAEINKNPKKLSEALQLARAARQAQARELVRTVANIILDSSQPLTATEIIEAVKQATGHEYHWTHIRGIINELTQNKEVAHRLETLQEREVRAGGKAHAKYATLFWAPYGDGSVPTRTIREAVSGVTLVDRSGRQSIPAPVKRGRGRPRKVQEEVELVDITPMASGNPVVDALIQMLIKQKTQALEEELAQTKQELEELRAKVKSLLSL